MGEDERGYRWFCLGDWNGFFGLMFDNLTVLSFLAGILVVAFGYPADIVYGRMFPGTALGVLFGNVVYSVMAFRLARRTGRSDVTAMPLGLDTPSTIGIALVVLGPAFAAAKAQGLTAREAALETWYLGMGTMVLIGLVKLALSFCGNWIRTVVPQAGLLGSLAGIGLVLIGFVPLVDVFAMPLVGLASLGLVLYGLVAQRRLPGKLPGVLAAVALGTLLYHALGPLGLLGASYHTPAPALRFELPVPSLLFLHGLLPALRFLPVAAPFALLTVVGGINVSESARVAGDDFSTRDVLLTEALATLVAGVCGGVAQSTPYIGQPAYKRMGARSGYTLLTGVFIGLGGVFGYVSFIVELIPRAVLAPILVFVALDIMSQAFLACPRRHAAAVAFAHLPTVARLVSIRLATPELVPPERFQALLVGSGSSLSETLVTIALGNGFILTALLWGAFVAELVDGRLVRSAAYVGLLALLSFFGVVHSALPDGALYLPWRLASASARSLAWQFALGYLLLAALLLALTRTRADPPPESDAVS